MTKGTSPLCEEVLCEMVQETLVELGLRPLTECNGEWPCPNLIDNVREVYHALSPHQSEPIEELLGALIDKKLPISSPKEVLKEDPFPCPVLQVDVYQPCKVSSCAYNVDHEWTRNCIYYYRTYKETTKLTIEELGLLLKRNKAEVGKVLKATMKKLRTAALKETIQQESEDVIVRMDPPNICVVCERPVEVPLKRTNQYVYCSDTCFMYKPPFVINLEKEFSLPVVRLLKVCSNTFRSPKAISQALGITPAKLDSLCRRYNIDLPSD